jgi:hypothetical protein
MALPIHVSPRTRTAPQMRFFDWSSKGNPGPVDCGDEQRRSASAGSLERMRVLSVDQQPSGNLATIAGLTDGRDSRR